jgi:choloylglycine hydrolase
VCTGIKIKTQDNSVIFARTFEFGIELDMGFIGIPAGRKFVGSAPENKPGLAWTAKYAVIGANVAGMPFIGDGLNEKGLHMGIFNFAEFAGWQEVAPTEYSKCLEAVEVATYVLTTVGTVDEAISALKEVKVGKIGNKWFDGMHWDVHYRLADQNGRAVAIEYMNGELHVHENPLGAFANSPNFDWHLTNLTNYINLSAHAWPAVDLGDLTLKPSSLGAGMAGLPGDFTSPSRFVRAVAFQETAVPSATADEGVKMAFHLLNLFDIPKGANVQTVDGTDYTDYTQATNASDLTNLRYFYKTYDSSQIRMVAMADFLESKPNDIVTFDISEKEAFENIADTAKPLG